MNQLSLKCSGMNKRITLLIVFLLAGMTVVRSQSLYITEKDGSVVSRTLSTLDKFTFSSDNLLVNYVSGSIETYSLSNVSKLSFKSAVTGVDELSVTGVTTMKVYPNPVSDIIYIQNAPETSYTVSVYRVNGSLVFTNEIASGGKSVDVSFLSQGFYFLNVNGRTFKFVKL
jgi:hypothetical protein